VTRLLALPRFQGIERCRLASAAANNGNWRLTFEFSDGNAYILDYEDYH